MVRITTEHQVNPNLAIIMFCVQFYVKLIRISFSGNVRNFCRDLLLFSSYLCLWALKKSPQNKKAWNKTKLTKETAKFRSSFIKIQIENIWHPSQAAAILLLWMNIYIHIAEKKTSRPKRLVICQHIYTNGSFLLLFFFFKFGS